MSDPRLHSLHLEGQPRREQFRAARQAIQAACGTHTLAGDLRMLVPDALGFKSIKWLDFLCVTDARVPNGWYERNYGVHLHVRAGAIPKDGPSAGITMCVALVSVLTRLPVRADCSMTGEITLRGEVLPVGGIKEKLLAGKAEQKEGRPWPGASYPSRSVSTLFSSLCFQSLAGV